MEEAQIMQRERDRKATEIVANFLLAVVTFRRLYDGYRQGALLFADLAKFIDDRGHSVLFSLKEGCQELFRRQRAAISEQEEIFDLTVGSIFHLAMKMREDHYQLEFYGPKFLELNKKDDGTSKQEQLVEQFQKILSRAEASFREGMEETAGLFEETTRQFPTLLGTYRSNGLLMRFLIEQSDLVKDVLGFQDPVDLFRKIYGEGESHAYRLAGESYFQSAFYAKATRAFTKALEKSPGDLNLQFKIHLSQGMEQFYSFAPNLALKSLEKCLSFSGKVEFSDSYRVMIRRVCLKIQEELPRRKKGSPPGDVIKKAQILQRQLEALPPAFSDVYPS
jgi:tetratricopeptide (TPR) repeat protein